MEPRPAQNSSLGSLLHMQHLIATHVLQSLDDSRRPMDDHRLRHFVRAQPEMHRPAARRGVAHAGGHVVVLRAALGGDLNPRADAVAVALGSLDRKSTRLNSSHLGISYAV